jgi:hypothetical protein
VDQARAYLCSFPFLALAKLRGTNCETSIVLTILVLLPLLAYAKNIDDEHIWE